MGEHQPVSSASCAIWVFTRRTLVPLPCMSSAVLLESDTVSQHNWSPVYEDHILWPHVPFLYILGLRFYLFVVIPLPHREVHLFNPVAS